MLKLKKFKISIIIFAILIIFTGCNSSFKTIKSVEDLANSNVGIYSSSEYDRILSQYVPTAKCKYYSSYADQISSLKSGKIDGFLTDEPLAKEILKGTKGLTVIDKKLTEDSYAFAISPKLTKLQENINKVLKDMKETGKLKEFEDKWMGDDENLKKLENYKYKASNGTLSFGTVSTIAPFSYIKNNEVVGYDIDVIKYICKELKYNLNIVEMSFDGIIPSLISNKIDLAGASIIVTEERKKSVLFSDADYTGGIVIVVREK